jgi:nicotinate-nucleotide adenylyltransferase
MDYGKSMKAGFPIARPGMRIGLLGGSFDPAHEGHVNITEAALSRFRLDRVWWLVAPQNPLKIHQPADLETRIAGARALLHDPRVVVTDIEAQLGTFQTADTIAALQGLYPGVRFVWLMGSDNLVQFHRWSRWREIAETVPIGVLARPESRLGARHARAATILRGHRLPEAQAASLATAATPVWVQVNLPMSKHSSTALRAVRDTAEKVDA